MPDRLEPDSAEREELASSAFGFLEDWYSRIPSLPASGTPLSDEEIAALASPPTEEGRPMSDILAELDLAGRPGVLHPSGGHLSYIPNGGLYSGAVAEFLAAGLNRYTGVVSAAPGMTAIETGVTRWIASLFGADEGVAILLSGGSMANLTAIVAARTNRLGDHFAEGVMYTSRHTHHSVEKAARIAGLRDDQVRQVPVDDSLRMRPDSLEEMVEEDSAAGRRPFLVVATAGTTDTGTIDDLRGLSGVARSRGLWMHTDAAYGGFFQLTQRGRHRLGGIELSDSIALDPHKGLSAPFGIGALVVRDPNHLIEANRGRGAYLDQAEVVHGLRDISSFGPELTRPFRGLTVWLPLHLHGVAPFREALDRYLDLAERAHRRLVSLEGIRAPWTPDLSVVAFGFEDDDTGRRAMQRVNDDRGGHVSSTEVEGRFVLRIAILNRRTTPHDVDHVIDLIEKALTD